MKRTIWLFVTLVWCVCGAAGQTPQARAGAKNAQPKFKAIWEPVNYTEDVSLIDVYFVNAQVGWVSGGGAGVILNTQDGGDHWTVQWGDPHGTDQKAQGFFFLDSTHGWARQGYNDLLQTSDGQLWVAGGKMDPYARDYVFTSETTGIAITEHDILRTLDGGRTYPWPVVNHCTAKVQVSGLTREVACSWTKLSFPTANIGYAAGFINDTQSAVLGKTSDGGATWSVSVLDSLAGGGAGDAWFMDENTGVIRTGYSYEGHLYKTTDGGATWKPTGGNRFGERIRFADPEVGFSFFEREFHFSVDGGLRWNGRNTAFPVNVNAWSFPQRDRGYAVGDHGMIYRYRIVPANYAAKGMLEAPMMPTNAK